MCCTKIAAYLDMKLVDLEVVYIWRSHRPQHASNRVRDIRVMVGPYHEHAEV